MKFILKDNHRREYETNDYDDFDDALAELKKIRPKYKGYKGGIF